MPTRHQVSLAESADEVGADVLIEKRPEEQIGPVDHIDHECLHLLIAEARELGPADFAGRGFHEDIRVVAGFGIGSDSGVVVFQDGVSEALLCHIFGQTLQNLWIPRQKSCAVSIHFRTPPSLSYPRRPSGARVEEFSLLEMTCGRKLRVLAREA